MPPNIHCECPVSGWCERHKMEKLGRQHAICQGTAKVRECGWKYWQLWERGGMGATAVAEPKLEQDWICDENAPPLATPPRSRTGLGDRAEQALQMIGITEDRVNKWLGRPCGCKERREKMNQLGSWVTRVLGGKTDDAEKYLDEMVQVSEE